jgi:hypothetical protein
MTEPEKIVPLDIVGDELDRHKMKLTERGSLWFLWGYLFGRAVASEPRLLHDEAKLREWCQSTFGASGRRRRKGP